MFNTYPLEEINSSPNFQSDELVLHRADIGEINFGEGKLGSNHGGPYQVRNSMGNGAYTIETLCRVCILKT